MDIVTSESSSEGAKEEAEDILEEISSRKPDSRLPLGAFTSHILSTSTGMAKLGLRTDTQKTKCYDEQL